MASLTLHKNCSTEPRADVHIRGFAHMGGIVLSCVLPGKREEAPVRLDSLAGGLFPVPTLIVFIIVEAIKNKRDKLRKARDVLARSTAID